MWYNILCSIVHWVILDKANVKHLQTSGTESSVSEKGRPSLYSVQTVIVTAQQVTSLVGGVRLEKLYPHQRYKVRVSAENALGVGLFSSDVLVSKYIITIYLN